IRPPDRRVSPQRVQRERMGGSSCPGGAEAPEAGGGPAGGAGALTDPCSDRTGGGRSTRPRPRC
ncbi:MAG: hypothetical protein WC277_10590, partial [Bacilli bacterium]